MNDTKKEEEEDRKEKIKEGIVFDFTYISSSFTRRKS